jgi:2'-5' RNA ligase superfamily
MKMAAISLGCALTVFFGGDGAAIASAGHGLVAIDVLLLPDATMTGRVRELNRVLQHSPTGFAFDSTHVPHLTLLQCYVRRPDLSAIEAAVDSVFRGVPPTGLELTATGYFGSPIDDLSAAGISIGATPALTRLQLDIVAAVAPFIRHGGTAAAFVDEPKSNTIASTASYVDHFLAAASGTNFRPHVTAGLDHAEFVGRLVARPFTPFTFKIEGAAIYQLGDIGTARKQLWIWRP